MLYLHNVSYSRGGKVSAKSVTLLNWLLIMNVNLLLFISEVDTTNAGAALVSWSSILLLTWSTVLLLFP